MNVEIIVIEEVNLDKKYSSFIEDAKVPEVRINVCLEIGAAVLSEASQGGYSFHQALTMATTAMAACEVLVLLGLAI